jgi:hypothetical protein
MQNRLFRAQRKERKKERKDKHEAGGEDREALTMLQFILGVQIGEDYHEVDLIFESVANLWNKGKHIVVIMRISLGLDMLVSGRFLSRVNNPVDESLKYYHEVEDHNQHSKHLCK